MNSHRSDFDSLINKLDSVIKTVAGGKTSSARSTPASDIAESQLSEDEKDHISRLMRINHCGEVCAQALYEGQAAGSGSPEISDTLKQAAVEEEDHLYWCEKRIRELGGRLSYMNPVFYGASWGIGFLMGSLGKSINYGFLAATEEEVCSHLEDHLNQIPEKDKKTRAILEQMLVDEAKHATTALHSGGAIYPDRVKKMMHTVSRLMTQSVYRI